MKNNLCIKLLLMLLTCLAGYVCMMRGFYPDEFYHLTSIVKVAKGGTPYLDFFRQQHDFYYQCMAVLVKPFLNSGAEIKTFIDICIFSLTLGFGLILLIQFFIYKIIETTFGRLTGFIGAIMFIGFYAFIVSAGINIIIALRVFNFLLILLTVFLTYRIAEKLFCKLTGLIASIMLISSYAFIISAIEIRPDIPMVICILGSFLFYFSYLEDNAVQTLFPDLGIHKLKIFFSGFCMGLAFVFLQKAIFPMVAMFLILLIDLVRKEITIKDCFLWLGGFIIIAGLYLFSFVDKGIFSNYILCNWTANLDFVKSAGSKFEMFTHGIKNDIFLWILGFIWIIFALLSKGFNNQKRLAIYCLVLFCLIYKSIPMQQYFLPFLPFLFILGAYFIKILLEEQNIIAFTCGKNFMRLKKIIGCVILIIAIIYPANRSYRRTIKKPIARSLERINYVLKNTTKNDIVFDYNWDFNCYLPTIPSFSFWENKMMKHVRKIYPVGYSTIEEILRVKPKFITKSYVDKYMKDYPGFSKLYDVSEIYPDLLIRKKDE